MTEEARPKNILVLGAGELGSAVIYGLRGRTRSITVLLREDSISSTDKDKQLQNQSFREFGVQFVPGDLANDSLDTLATTFQNYDTIISCIGFGAGRGIQLKIARAVLQAGVHEFIPWQFGVDYDVIGRGSPQDLFDEQLDVRDLLRAQSATKWLIISTGMFTSFLFHPAFGVVDFEHSIVRALGNWENRVTVTTPEDIGWITAEVVSGGRSETMFGDCRPIFVAGDTISYDQLARLLEKLTGRTFTREVVTVENAVADARNDPENSAFHKYRAVFGQGRGVAWNVEEAWNHRVGIPAMTAEEWAVRNLEEHLPEQR